MTRELTLLASLAAASASPSSMNCLLAPSLDGLSVFFNGAFTLALGFQGASLESRLGFLLRDLNRGSSPSSSSDGYTVNNTKFD